MTSMIFVLFFFVNVKTTGFQNISARFWCFCTKKRKILEKVGKYVKTVKFFLDFSWVYFWNCYRENGNGEK